VDLSGFQALRSVLRIRPFRRLWLVLGAASLGDWLSLLATSLFAAQQVENNTAKGVAFGGLIAIRLLPAFVLGPLAGVLADHFDRRYLMVACDVLRFAFQASIPAAALFTDNGALIIGWAAVATFANEAITMVWVPAKEAAVPNLLPRARLEAANQLTLVTTYGVSPVLAAILLASLTRSLGGVTPPAWLTPTAVALYFLALSRLATALVVLFGIPEISGRTVREADPVQPEHRGIMREFADGWRYVSRTPLVRGLVLGILGAFAGGGVVVGVAQFFAKSLGGGDATFNLLFAALFIGLCLGIALGPRFIGGLSRRRWFGLSIILAGTATILLGFAPHLTVAVFGTVLVGVGAGMAFLSGTTLLGTEVGDDVRGRVFAFVQTSTRGVLMLATAFSGVIVGFGGSRRVAVGGVAVQLSTTRLMLLVAGAAGVVAGVSAFRQMDVKKGVPILADIWSSMRGRPLGVPEVTAARGLFIVFEGGEGAGKSTQAGLLADWLRVRSLEVVRTREPGATELGARIRSLVLDGGAVSARAEALLYAADRAHHVSTLVRPALARGAIVVSDRYVDSSLAYQGAGRTLPANEVLWLSNWATGGLRPHLVVLLDIDPGEGLGRVGERGKADRLESEALAFHERVRYAFLDLAADDLQRYLVLDATLPVDELAERIRERVARLIPDPETNLVATDV